MIFFTDRDLGHLFPTILREAGLEVQIHDDNFQETAERKAPDDVEWLPVVGERGWIVISHDQRMGRNPIEIDAIMRAGVRMFIVVGSKTPFPDLARNFVANIHKIERFLEAHPEPFIARVYRPTTEQLRKGSRKKGEVKLWLSHSDWLKKIRGRR